MHLSPTLAALDLPPWALALGVAVFVMISLLMIGVILLQRPQGGGLTAALGGSQGAGQTAFGTKTGDALTIFTCVVFALYVGVAVFLNHAAKPQSATAAPAAPAAITPSTTTPPTTPTTTPTTTPGDATPINPATSPGTNPGTNPAPTTLPGTTPPATNPPATNPPATNPPAPAPELPKNPDPAPTQPGQPK